MRTSNKCIKCGSLAIGHVSRRYERPGYRDDQLPNHMLGVLGSRNVGVGPLESFVCTDCGYVETYVIAPTTVQFEQIRGFSWVNEPKPQRGTFR